MEIVLSLSPGPAHIDRAWQYCRYANMWRITDDFWDNWELLKNMFWRCELWQDHVKEGCFPDCDMLPLGKVGKGFETGERDCLFNQGSAAKCDAEFNWIIKAIEYPDGYKPEDEGKIRELIKEAFIVNSYSELFNHERVKNVSVRFEC